MTVVGHGSGTGATFVRPESENAENHTYFKMFNDRVRWDREEVKFFWVRERLKKLLGCRRHYWGVRRAEPPDMH